MKKIISLALLIALAVYCVIPAAPAEDKKLSVVATIFPIYDWTRVILGDDTDASLTLLLDSGVDLHSYQPTAADIMRIAACDVFIYVGGESDEWVEDALKEAVSPGPAAVDLMEAMGSDLKTEEIVEGMEHEHHDHDEDHDHDDEDHDHEHDEEDHDHDHEHGDEADEHVWLSLRGAKKLVGVIASALAGADPDRAGIYEANAAAYIAELEALDREYTDALSDTRVDTVLFGDRVPFRYLADDYGLNYYAAFAGCSAETEASFQTIAFLSQKVDELGLGAVLTIEGTNHKIAETIIRTAKAGDLKLLTMDSMQGRTLRDVQAGVTYLKVMRDNLEVLKQALD